MRFNHKLFALFLKGCLNLGCDLVRNVVDVCATFRSADSVHKTYLLELTIAKAANYFPPLWLLLNNLNHLLTIKVQVCVFNKVFDIEFLAIQHHSNFPVSNTSNIVNSFSHQCNNILVQCFHLESLQIRPECYFGEVLSNLLLNQRLLSHRHVVLEHLFVNSFRLLVTCLNHELLWENVCKFSSKAIPATSNLLFMIIVVARGKQLAKD